MTDKVLELEDKLVTLKHDMTDIEDRHGRVIGSTITWLDVAELIKLVKEIT